MCREVRQVADSTDDARPPSMRLAEHCLDYQEVSWMGQAVYIGKSALAKG